MKVQWKRVSGSAVMMFAISSAALAGEGMWMPQQVPQLSKQLKEMGLKLDPQKFADLTGDPMGAIISLGGCSASFVSPEGLVVTNHHCAYGAIQYNSTPERNLIADGFVAKTQQEELSAGPGSRVFVTTAIEDVTSRIVGSISAKTSDFDRYQMIDRNRKQLVSECEKEGGVRCRVDSFFEGTQYYRLKQMEIRDVRLVYAPARGIGEFGGETDNWMWPRHTGDWAFYRAYVGKDGKPADFSKDNMPYKPKRWLKVATDGVDPGDLVIVAGYPGRTFRYQTAGEIDNAQMFSMPTYVRYAKDYMRILNEVGKGNKDIELKNASRIKGSANTLKNYEGSLAGLERVRLVETRKKQQTDVDAWIGKDSARSKKYTGVFRDLDQLNERKRVTRERDVVTGWLFRSSLLSQASQLYRLSLEKAKPDAEREMGYQERDVPRIRESVDRAQRSLELTGERAALKYFLHEAAKLPSSQRIAALDDALAATGEKATEAQIDRLLDRLYSNTKMADVEVRRAMMNETPEQLRARNDAFMNLAAALSPMQLEAERRDKEIAGAMSRVRPRYLDALREMRGGTLYPDANGTLRVTFGKVEGYMPKDAVRYEPRTSLKGIVTKDTGEEPFDSPKALLTAARAGKTGPYRDSKLGDVPVNFLSTCDTTGGNSGSATLNAKGELTGLLFDGNFEALGSDYQPDPAITRSIHVDAQFMLWVMDAVDKAHNLLREMNLPVHFGG